MTGQQKYKRLIISIPAVLVVLALGTLNLKAEDPPAPPLGQPELRTHIVTSGDAALLALKLQADPANRSSRIEAISSTRIMAYAPPAVQARIQAAIADLTKTKAPPRKMPGDDVKNVGSPDKPNYELSLPLNGKKDDDPKTGTDVGTGKANDKGKNSGKKGAPITIGVIGNRVVIRSDDQDALAQTAQLIRMLLETPEGEGDFTVIPLKHAPAMEAAQVINEVFNGPQQNNRNQRGSSNPFAQFVRNRGSQQQQPQTPPRVRVVAEPNSNSLLIKASPLDLFEIKRLLSTAIDSGMTDSEAVVRTYVLPPLSYTNATDVASVITEVYREYMNENPRATQTSSRSSRSRGSTQNRNVDAYGNPRPVQLSVGVDERTNSLILATTEKLHKEVSDLVKQLDENAKNTKQVVKLISVPGVDPAVIQQAVDALQGRQSSGSTSPFGSRLGGGTSPFGGNSRFGGGSTSPFGGGSRFGSGGTSPFGGRLPFGGGTNRGGTGGGTRGSSGRGSGRGR